MKSICTNICSVESHISEFCNHLEIELPDIICLNETLLTDKKLEKFVTLVCSTTHFNNNKHILLPTSNNVNKFRGSSIYTSLDPDLNQTKFEVPSKDHELLALNFKSNTNDKKYCVINGYLSPSITDHTKIEDFYATAAKLINKKAAKTGIIFNGDLNSKNNLIFPTKSPNYAGKILHQFLSGDPIGNT